jgi:translocation and assembly module TamA
VEIDAPDALKGILQEHLDLARYTDRTDISDDQFQYMVETVATRCASSRPPRAGSIR